MIGYSKPVLQSGIISFLLVSLLLAAASCHSHSKTSSPAAGTVTTSPVKQATKQIDSLHEEVMNSIGPLRKLEDSVRQKIRGTRDTVTLSRVAGALNSYDTAMFTWMGQYDTQLKGKSDSEKISYLHSQFRQLSRLNETMDSTMHHARMLLK